MIQYDKKTALFDPHPGPMGGDYNISYFYDENDKPCERKYAHKVLYVAYDSQDEVVDSHTFNIQPLTD